MEPDLGVILVAAIIAAIAVAGWRFWRRAHRNTFKIAANDSPARPDSGDVRAQRGTEKQAGAKRK